MEKFWIVRADKFWYKFTNEKKALEHFEYIRKNTATKYKQIEKIYLAEYSENKTPKILKLWNREKTEEMER